MALSHKRRHAKPPFCSAVSSDTPKRGPMRCHVSVISRQKPRRRRPSFSGHASGFAAFAAACLPPGDNILHAEHGMPCARAKAATCGNRAILPSSLVSSQSTPHGSRPARVIKSTVASVCPRLSNTPPGRARRGKTWPGRCRSSGRRPSGWRPAQLPRGLRPRRRCSRRSPPRWIR